ncbi:MAG: type II secretion system GspH family protein [Ruminococcus sp.]|nr:type II secretion system GspH family protein [Ruminococcus sp.]
MKTTKKGFTLIELIVVIAIIGVLAAILVPSMLGYVKKSKIQGANSSATTFLNAFNSAGTDLDEIDSYFKDGKYTFDGNGNLTPPAEITANSEISEATDVFEAIQPFFGDVKKIKALVQVEDGVAIACVVSSGKYLGTSPQIYSTKKYPSSGLTDEKALTGAVAVSKGTKKMNDDFTA